MVFGLGIGDVQFAIILAAIVGGMTTGFVVWAGIWLPWHIGPFRIAEVYDERPGGLFLLVKRRIGIGAQSFYVGKEFQFVVPNPAPILFYENGRGVLQYVLSKTRPRHTEVGKYGGERVKVEPESARVSAPPNVGKKRKLTVAVPLGDGKSQNITTEVVETPDTESRSVNLFQRRGFLNQTLKATQGVNLKAAIPFVILAGLACFMLGYVIFLNVHPGMVQAPPPGYFYKAFPIPTNSTGVHT